MKARRVKKLMKKHGIDGNPADGFRRKIEYAPGQESNAYISRTESKVIVVLGSSKKALESSSAPVSNDAVVVFCSEVNPSTVSLPHIVEYLSTKVFPTSSTSAAPTTEA